MQTNTPQQLGRTSDLLATHSHGPDVICLHCFFVELEHDDFRGALALLMVLQMKRLVRIRVAAGEHVEADAWHRVLDADAMMRDIASNDPVRSVAASELRAAFADYIQHWVILRHPEPRPLIFGKLQHDIVERTYACLDAIEAEGREADIMPPSN